jgi:hypothetical protein
MEENASRRYFDVLVEVVLLSVLPVPCFLLFLVFFFVLEVVIEVLVFCALLAAGAAIRKGTATAATRVDITNFFIEFSPLCCGGCLCLNSAPEQQLIGLDICLFWLLLSCLFITAHNSTLPVLWLRRHHSKTHTSIPNLRDRQSAVLMKESSSSCRIRNS